MQAFSMAASFLFILTREPIIAFSEACDERSEGLPKAKANSEPIAEAPDSIYPDAVEYR